MFVSHNKIVHHFVDIDVCKFVTVNSCNHCMIESFLSHCGPHVVFDSTQLAKRSFRCCSRTGSMQTNFTSFTTCGRRRRSARSFFSSFKMSENDVMPLRSSVDIGMFLSYDSCPTRSLSKSPEACTKIVSMLRRRGSSPRHREQYKDQDRIPRDQD